MSLRFPNLEIVPDAEGFNSLSSIPPLWHWCPVSVSWFASGPDETGRARGRRIQTLDQQPVQSNPHCLDGPHSGGRLSWASLK